MKRNRKKRHKDEKKETAKQESKEQEEEKQSRERRLQVNNGIDFTDEKEKGHTTPTFVLLHSILSMVIDGRLHCKRHVCI